MFQREVAERIVATPGSKTYGRLSVLAGWRTEAKILFDIAPSAFVPPPKVTSSLVQLVPARSPLPCDRRALERVTAAAFGQRRKMLRASLKSLGHRSHSAARKRRYRPDGARGGYSGRRLRRARQRISHDPHDPPIDDRLCDAAVRDGGRGAGAARHARCWCASAAAACAIPTCICRTAISASAATRSSTSRAGRALPFTLGHEIAGVVEKAGPDADVKIGQAAAVFPWIGCGAMRGLPRGRGESLRGAAPSRHPGRRRLRHPCAGAASALPDRSRAAAPPRSPAPTCARA